MKKIIDQKGYNDCIFGVATKKPTNKGFTLAEAIVVIVMLGVVAAITIPTTLHRTTERANKLKIKKALSTYEAVINKIYIEQGLPRTVAALNEWANDGATDCANVKRYFKIVEEGNVEEHEGCKIKTSDGLWWDFGSGRQKLNYYLENDKVKNNPDKSFVENGMSNTIVAFKKENLTPQKANSYTYDAFVFVTDIDQNGSIRINDSGYAKKAYDIEDVNGQKGAYGSRNNIQSTLKVQAYLEGQAPIGWSGTNKYVYCYDCTMKYISGTNLYENYYDKYGNLVYQKRKDINGNIYETTYTYDASGMQLSYETTKNGKFNSKQEYKRDMYGNITSYYSEWIDSYGKTQKSAYEQEYTYDEYGRVLSYNQKYTQGSQKGQENSVNYVRDAKGNIVYSAYNYEYANGNTYSYSYDYKNGIDESTSTGSVTNTKKPEDSYTYTTTSKGTNEYWEDTSTYNYADGRITTEYYKYDNDTGATIGYASTIKDKNGNVVEDWTSSTTKENGNFVTTYVDKINGSKDVEAYDKNGNYLGGSGLGYYSDGSKKYEYADKYDSSGKYYGGDSVNWDASGNKTSEYHSNYTFDESGKQTGYTTSNYNYTVGTNSENTNNYTYYSDGKQATQTYSSSGVAQRTNGTLYNYTTDYSYEYTYDQYGNRNGTKYTYYRTENGKVTKNYTETTNYTYDQYGNITSTTYCYNKSCKTNSL